MNQWKNWRVSISLLKNFNTVIFENPCLRSIMLDILVQMFKLLAFWMYHGRYLTILWFYDISKWKLLAGWKLIHVNLCLGGALVKCLLCLTLNAVGILNVLSEGVLGEGLSALQLRHFIVERSWFEGQNVILWLNDGVTLLFPLLLPIFIANKRIISFHFEKFGNQPILFQFSIESPFIYI